MYRNAFDFKQPRHNQFPVIASAAKQSMARHRQIEDGLLRSARNDGARSVISPRSRGVKTPELCQQPPSTERAQGMPGARCTRSLACKNKKAHEVVTTSSPEQPGIPRAMVLTAYFEISPVIGLFVTVACEYDSSAPGRADFAPQNLTPASRRQDHTTSPSAATSFVCAPVRRSRVGPRPAITIARRRCRVHRIPCPTSVTIAKRPSRVGRDGGDIEVIWGRREPKNFCEQDWTTQITLIRFNKFACGRTP